MKEKILITRPMFADVVEYLKEYFEVTLNEGPKYTHAGLKEALGGMSGVMIAGGEKVDAELLRGVEGLRAICVSAAGFNNLDVDAITRAGIIATNSPGPADDTVADFAWGSMIAVARRLTEAEHWVADSHWKGSAGSRFFGTDVFRKTLGIMGMGRIGRAIALRAIGFHMKTLYHNRRQLEPVLEEESHATYVSKKQLLSESDFIVLALPYSGSTHHIIGAEELALVKPTSFLINIARGGLIDEEALTQALKKKQIAGAALDVFEKEPMIYEGLLGLSNVLLTPHIAGATAYAQHGLAMMAAENLVAALGYGPGANMPPAILNPEVLKK
jgi:lactate dehydrogenase-like 2-hydroxyacid dehydrogenase